MNHNFKPGDLALTLIGLPVLPAGSVVELQERIPKGEPIRDIDGTCYIAGADGWRCSHGAIDARLIYADIDLMPLRGDFQPERQKSKEVPA
jgi:hypothetical protein